MRFRSLRFRIKDEMDYDTWHPIEIVHESWEYLSILLNENQLEAHQPMPADELRAYVLRIWRRDKRRLNYALDRARTLPDRPTTVFIMKQTDSGFGESPELRDLFAYLHDRVKFYRHARFPNSRGERTIPPLLIGQDAWHCTQPSGWTRKPLLEKSPPTQRPERPTPGAPLALMPAPVDAAASIVQGTQTDIEPDDASDDASDDPDAEDATASAFYPRPSSSSASPGTLNC